MKRLLCVIAICLSVALFAVGKTGEKKQAARVIEITASRFTFEPNEITVKKGEEVTFLIHSKDVAHGLVIEGLGVRADEVKKGAGVEVNFTPTTVGTFEGKCAHFCGTGHGSMTLTVHVVE